MSETQNKYYRSDKSRFYDQPMRTNYFTLGSRKTVVGGLSRLDTTRSSLSNSLIAENELECQDILSKRGFFKRIFYKNFNNIFNKNIIKNNNNCKKYGIILLIMFIFNLALAIFVFIVKDPVECQKELTDFAVGEKHKVTINAENCNLVGSGNLIDFSKIYVYYTIFNYPFHFSNVYKLHSPVQLSGKISRNRSDLDNCNTYAKVHVNGINRVINPCGSHVINVFNDRFKFLDADSGKELELNEDNELLIKNQEFENSKNIPKDDKLKFNDLYWMDENFDYIEEIKVGLVKNYDLINGWNKKNLIHEQLNSDKSGEGVLNGHFVQWLTPPPFPNFSKLYGVLKGPVTLPLTLDFESNYDVKLFNGKKFILIRASRFNLGNLNLLRVLFLVFSILSLGFSLLLLLYRPKNKNHLLNLL